MTTTTAQRFALDEQGKAQIKLSNSLGYLNTLARARAEATERLGPWRDKEPSAEWWAELVAAERRNAKEIADEYVASLPLAARAPELADVLERFTPDEIQRLINTAASMLMAYSGHLMPAMTDLQGALDAARAELGE